MAHQVRELLDQLGRTAKAAADAAICTYSIPEGELCGMLADATRLVRQLEGGLVMPLIAETDERRAYASTGKSSTVQVLTDAGMARTRAKGWVKTMRSVAGPGSDLGATGEAMRTGRIDFDAAKRVVEGLKQMSGDVGHAGRVDAERAFLATAVEHGGDAVPDVIEAVCRAVEGDDAYDERKINELDAAEKRAFAHRSASFSGCGIEGVSEFKLRLDTLTMTRLRHLLHRIIEQIETDTDPDNSPARPMHLRLADAAAEFINAQFTRLLNTDIPDSTDHPADGNSARSAADDIGATDQNTSDREHGDAESDGAGPERFAAGRPDYGDVADDDDISDCRDTAAPDDAEQRGDAGVGDADRDPTGRSGSPDGLTRRSQGRRAGLVRLKLPQLLIGVDYDAIQRRLKSGTILDTGEKLSPTAVARLACEANLLPVWMTRRLTPLAVAATHRFFTGPQLSGLIARDKGCIWPGCDRPPSGCHAHHNHPFAVSGITTIEDGCLLCVTHHQIIHRGEWTVRIATDGLPEFVPPAWIDPTRTPQRHQRHRTSRWIRAG